jgi:acyl-CoA thioester hydrolase
MFTTIVTPRFGDTDALMHINNTVLASWFELGRNPVFRIFVPDFLYKNWNLILAHTDYDFVDETFFQYNVEIKTYVKHIGNKSFTTYHEAWQEGRLCAKGNATMVHYDFNNKVTIEIPADIKEKLKEHLPPENYFADSV